MANDLNRVFLIGRLTQDPELKQTANSTSFVRFSIANNKSYVQSSGERKEEVSYFNCVAWSKLAEVINQYCHKGKQVAVEGRLKQNSWQDSEGKKQYAVDVVVENLQLLGGNTNSGSQMGANASQQMPSNSSNATASPNVNIVQPNSASIPNLADIGDDDIPF